MERLRILLINPPQIMHIADKPVSSPPLGLAYLAGVLEKQFDVKILDCMVEGFNKRTYYTKDINRWGVDPDELSLRITRWEPDVVGISCIYSTQEEVIDMVASVYKSYAKIRGKNIIVVVGGHHASSVPWEIMKNKNVDFVVIGEGEIPMYQLCQALQTGMDVSSIDGIAYRDHSGKVMVNPRFEYLEDLDKLPMPARHLLLMDKYLQVQTYFQPKSSNFTNMILSRGCDSRCTFCAVPGCFGGKFRPRSPKNIIEEMQFLMEKYLIKEFYFEDDNFFRDLDIATELCQLMIDKKLNILWSLQAGVVARGYSLKLLELMKASGCYKVTLNIESGSDRVLANVTNSPHDRNIILNMLEALRNVGIGISANFRVGFPGETREEIMETFDFISKCEISNYNVYYFMPIPGTPMWEKCKKENLFSRPFKSREYLLENSFLRTEHFDPLTLSKIYEEGSKMVWKRRVATDAGVLLGTLGNAIDKHVLHPFTSKQKRK